MASSWIPAPERRPADLRDQTALADVSSQFLHTPTRQGDVMGGGQFTGPGLNADDQFWGEKTGAARSGTFLQPG